MASRFYIDTTGSYPESAVIYTEGTNTFDNTPAVLIEQMDRLAISSSGNEVIPVTFKVPYKKICKVVNIAGKIQVNLSNSGGTMYFPIGFVNFTDITTEGFTVTCPKYDGASYYVELNYRAVGI